MIDIPTLQTKRLTLRPHREADFQAYAAMWADPAVTRFIAEPLSREAAWTRFLRQRGIWAHFGFGFFAFEEKETGLFVGEGGFHDLRRAIDPSIEGTMEAGWGLVASRQGRGLAEEAMIAALDWADVSFPARRVTCIINPDHAASLRVAGKLGFAEFARTEYHGRPITLLERRSKVVAGRR